VLLQETEKALAACRRCLPGPGGGRRAGGLELEITCGPSSRPDARAMLERQDEALGVVGPCRRQASPVLFRAMAPDRLCSPAAGTELWWAWRCHGPSRARGRVHVLVLVDAASRRQGAGRALLLALEAGLRHRGWAMGRAGARTCGVLRRLLRLGQPLRARRLNP